MIAEVKLRRDAARAEHAKRLIEDEMLSECFSELETAYIERWRVTNIEDQTGREKLFLAVNVVRKVKDHLAKVVSDGVLARKELDQMASEAERKKRFGIV